MPNDSTRNMPTAMPSHGDRWRQALRIALLVGSAAATLIAVTVVISLFWWMSTISAAKPERVAAPKPPPVAAPVSKPAVAAAPALAPTRPRAPVPTPAGYANRSSVATAPAPVQAGAPQLPEPLGHRQEPDAAKNHQLATGLSRLANDPEALRRLGLPRQPPQ